MRKLNTAFVLVLVLFASSAFALTDPIGQILSIQGKAVAIGSDKKVRSLKLKSPVFLNDKISTRDGSKLQIIFDDNSVVAQGE
ncbi:unnamed protein product, partial [marine sediment metagenome]